MHFSCQAHRIVCVFFVFFFLKETEDTAEETVIVKNVVNSVITLAIIVARILIRTEVSEHKDVTGQKLRRIF